ncbi:hypothetical protein LguiA_034177 [Lonicera macranthoides]
MNTFSHVPPGFRFHPTDEELVDYYLRKKVASKRIDLDVIKDVDLYKIEPWDLQELCKLGTEDQNEWYFFSHKDKKYPTGTRTNRATKAGFWKATGRDKAIYVKHCLVGMRKTLVFYKGRAPNGQKSDWIMHEYRLETNENGAPQEEGWVVCRVFKKRITTVRRMDDHDSICWYDEQVSFMPDFNSPNRPYSNPSYNNHHYPCKQELELQYNNNIPQHDSLFLQLPHLESPKMPYSFDTSNNNATNLHSSREEQIISTQQENINSIYVNNTDDQVTDWRVMDKFVASQLSQEDSASKENITYANALIDDDSKRQEVGSDCASMSISSCQIDLWK